MTKVWNINAPQGRPLRDIHKICRIGTSFKDAIAVKVSLDLLKALWSYGVFNLTENVLKVLYQHTKFGVARISPAAGLAKKH